MYKYTPKHLHTHLSQKKTDSSTKNRCMPCLNVRIKSMFSLAIKAQWIKALKEISTVFTDSGHFSINGTKISSHHLFIGVTIFCQLWWSATHNIAFYLKIPVAFRNIFWHAYKSGIFKLLVVWSFRFWFCDFFLEKLIHWKQISLLIGSKILKQWLRNILIYCQYQKLKWHVNIINVPIQSCNEFQAAWPTGFCSRIVQRGHSGC